jgi:hypothetical protein
MEHKKLWKRWRHITGAGDPVIPGVTVGETGDGAEDPEEA